MLCIIDLHSNRHCNIINSLAGNGFLVSLNVFAHRIDLRGLEMWGEMAYVRPGAKTEASIPLHKPHLKAPLILYKHPPSFSFSTIRSHLAFFQHNLSIASTVSIYFPSKPVTLCSLEMASNVVVLYNQRRLTVKTTPTRSLSDVHSEACAKFGLDPLRYGLKFVFSLPLKQTTEQANDQAMTNQTLQTRQYHSRSLSPNTLSEPNPRGQARARAS